MLGFGPPEHFIFSTILNVFSPGLLSRSALWRVLYKKDGSPKIDVKIGGGGDVGAKEEAVSNKSSICGGFYP